VKHFPRFAFLTVISLIWLFPLFWMVSTAITPNELVLKSDSLIPARATLENFRYLLFASQRISLLSAFANSLIVTAAQIAVILAVDILAAYAFARFRFFGEKALFAVVVSSLIIPGYLLITPIFIFIKNLRLVNTLPGVFLPGMARVIGIFLLRQFFMSVPKDMDDSAKMDGAGSFTILVRIIMPISKAAIATLAIITFLYSWNNFLWPLIVTNDVDKMILPIALAYLVFSAFSSASSYGYIMAAVFIATLPAILFFLFAKNYIVRGIATTGIKS